MLSDVKVSSLCPSIKSSFDNEDKDEPGATVKLYAMIRKRYTATAKPKYTRKTRLNATVSTKKPTKTIFHRNYT
jgi:hypothetical protein